jgi:hypothetical protein
MKKLLSVLVVLGMVNSVDAIDRLNVRVNVPAHEESTPSWENDEMSIEATVAPYDDERIQIDFIVSAKTETESVVISKPRIITYMGEEASLVVRNEKDEQLEIVVSPAKAKEASMQVEVIKAEQDAEQKEEAAQDA